GRVEDVALEAGATDHGTRGDRRRRVGERELEEEEGEEGDRRVERASVVVGLGDVLQEEVVMAEDAVADTELEREPECPVQKSAQARVEDAFHEDVHGLT